MGGEWGVRYLFRIYVWGTAVVYFDQGCIHLIENNEKHSKIIKRTFFIVGTRGSLVSNWEWPILKFIIMLMSGSHAKMIEYLKKAGAVTYFSLNLNYHFLVLLQKIQFWQISYFSYISKYFLFQSCLNFLCFGILESVLPTRLNVLAFIAIFIK